MDPVIHLLSNGNYTIYYEKVTSTRAVLILRANTDNSIGNFVVSYKPAVTGHLKFTIHNCAVYKGLFTNPPEYNKSLDVLESNQFFTVDTLYERIPVFKPTGEASISNYLGVGYPFRPKTSASNTKFKFDYMVAVTPEGTCRLHGFEGYLYCMSNGGSGHKGILRRWHITSFTSHDTAHGAPVVIKNACEVDSSFDVNYYSKTMPTCTHTVTPGLTANNLPCSSFSMTITIPYTSMLFMLVPTFIMDPELQKQDGVMHPYIRRGSTIINNNSTNKFSARLKDYERYITLLN